MKKFTLSAAVAMLAIAGFAATPQSVRSVSGLRTLRNQQPHRTAAVAVAPAADFRTADAPENAKTVPYSSTLGKEDLAGFTDIDANTDGCGWQQMGTYSVCNISKTTLEGADDWRITPPVLLQAGKTYQFDIEVSGSTTATKKATYEICMGSAPAVDGQSTVLFAKADYPGEDYTKLSKTFTVAADGYYYFGIHCLSLKSVCTLSRVRNLSVTEYAEPVDAPAAGTVTYAVKEPKTDMKVDVTYVAPVLTQSGAELKEISRVEIFNWVYPDKKYVVENPQPGQTLTTTLDLMEGQNNRIRAIAYVGETAGTVAETKNFYAGLDIPLAPQNVKVVLSDDFKSATVSWDPVSADGENGGYVNVDEVKYYIFDAFGSYYDPALVEDAKSPVTFTFDEAVSQDFAAYQVTAGNDKGYSLATNSNVVVTGPAAATPWHESFTDCYYGNPWMVDLQSQGNASGSLWYDNELQTNTDAAEGTEPEYMHPHDLDNGFMLILPAAKDDCFGLNSVKVDISKAAHPVLEFFYQGKGSRLEALVARNEEDFVTEADIDLQQAPTEGWTLCRVNLDKYRDARYIRVGLRMTAVHNDDTHTWSVPVDNIRVIDLTEFDYRIAYTRIDKPVAGKENNVIFTVENMGTQAGRPAIVELHNGEDNVLAFNGFEALQAGEVRQTTAKFTPSVLDTEPYDLYCQIVSPADNFQGNNVSAHVQVEVEQSTLTPVGNLALTTPESKSVELTWTAPDFAALTQNASVKEGFEDADKADFAAVEWGGWRFDDKDAQPVYGIIHDYDNPYYGMRVGFQVFDYTKAGLPESELVDVTPHSGNRMLIARSCEYKNSNWAISPRLSGEAQTISFWAKSFTSAIPEDFTVYYSTTDNKTTSFTNAVAVDNYPAEGGISEDWTEYSAALPAGAKYFAIEHNSTDSYIIYMDDFTFQVASEYPADLAVEKYNVWRDGKLLKSVTEPQCTDAPEENGTYSYRVSACYNHGESRACDAVEAHLTALSVSDIEAEGVSVSAGKDYVAIEGAEGKNVLVAAADGRVLYSGIGKPAMKIAAANGLYLVSVDSRVFKALVR